MERSAAKRRERVETSDRDSAMTKSCSLQSDGGGKQQRYNVVICEGRGGSDEIAMGDGNRLCTHVINDYCRRRLEFGGG